MNRLVFLDCETTGLDPERHEIWEVGVVVREEPTEQERNAASRARVAIDVNRREYVWQLPVDLGRADPIALNVGQFYERRGEQGTTNYFPGLDAFDQRLGGEVGGGQSPKVIAPKVLHPSNLPWWCAMFAKLSWGAHVVGAIPSFDCDRLGRLMVRNNACPGWHYHLEDIEALAVGFAIGRCHGIAIAGDIVKFGGAVDAANVARAIPWRSEDLSRAIGVDPDRFDKHTALGDARWAEAVFDAVRHPKPPRLPVQTTTATVPETVDEVPWPWPDRHGWIVPLRDPEMHAKCGGPGICELCKMEQAEANRRTAGR